MASPKVNSAAPSFPERIEQHHELIKFCQRVMTAAVIVHHFATSVIEKNAAEKTYEHCEILLPFLMGDREKFLKVTVRQAEALSPEERIQKFVPHFAFLEKIRAIDLKQLKALNQAWTKL